MIFPIGSLILYFVLAQAVTPEVIEHTQAGTQAQEKGQLDVAIAEFLKVTELQPAMASGFASLGSAYFQKGSYDLAIPALQKAVDLNPQLMGSHQMLGVALLLRGNATAALPHLDKMRMPELMGLAYLEAGQLSNAIAALHDALAQRPSDPDLLYYFGQATALASKRAFDQVLATNPGSARAHQVAGDRDAVDGRGQDAAREYLEAMKLKPYTAGLHLALGRLLAAAGNLPGALVEFRAETAMQPESAEAGYQLGSVLLQLGQTKDALVELARADLEDPETPAIMVELGKAALASGDAARAEKVWTRLLEIQKTGDSAVQAHKELFGMYRQAGRQAEADREWQEYQKLAGLAKQ